MVTSAQDEEANDAEKQKQFHADDTQRCTSFHPGALTPERKWAWLHWLKRTELQINTLSFLISVWTMLMKQCPTKPNILRAPPVPVYGWVCVRQTGRGWCVMGWCSALRASLPWSLEWAAVSASQWELCYRWRSEWLMPISWPHSGVWCKDGTSASGRAPRHSSNLPME